MSSGPWDITKLMGPQKWTCFYLYVIIDIFSRRVVGRHVADTQSAALFRPLFQDAAAKHAVPPGQFTLHADRGPSMKAKATALMLADLGVTKSHSRPYTSNDNRFSESHFKTMKYQPQCPRRFGCIQDAKAFCRAFFDWYNRHHHHLDIGLMTPTRSITAKPTMGPPRVRKPSTSPSAPTPSASSASHPIHPKSPPRSGSIRQPAPPISEPDISYRLSQCRWHVPGGPFPLFPNLTSPFPTSPPPDTRAPPSACRSCLPMSDIKRVVLAYSGGLDTSVILKWLQVTYGCEVVTFTADLGQGEELEPARAKAKLMGLPDEHIYIDDLREEFVRDFVFPMMRANARYEGDYLLGTSIARPLITKRLIEIAHETGADAIAHGATGKGNDQVRFELSAYALDPNIKVIAPWREWDLTSRTALIAWAEQHQIPVPRDKRGESPFSTDANLLHTSSEGKVLEDPWE